MSPREGIGMKTLWLDTASKYLYVGLSDGRLLFSSQKVGKNNHSELLLNTIKEGMNSLKWSPEDLDQLVVGIGPGSYTGLRVSLTVAKMFAWSLNIPLFTISSLDFALSGYTPHDGLYLSLLAAKRDYHYMKIVKIKNNISTPIHQETFLMDDEIKTIILEKPAMIIIEEEQFSYNPEYINENLLTKCEDIFLLEPNYLRGVL